MIRLRFLQRVAQGGPRVLQSAIQNPQSTADAEELAQFVALL